MTFLTPGHRGSRSPGDRGVRGSRRFLRRGGIAVLWLKGFFYENYHQLPKLYQKSFTADRGESAGIKCSKKSQHADPGRLVQLVRGSSRFARLRVPRPLPRYPVRAHKRVNQCFSPFPFKDQFKKPILKIATCTDADGTFNWDEFLVEYF